MRSKLAGTVFLLSFQLLIYQGASTCPTSSILAETLSSGSWTYNLEDSFPSVPTTQPFHAITIGLWVFSAHSLAKFLQFEGDGNKDRISLDFTSAAGLGSVKAKVITDQSTLSSQTVTIAPPYTDILWVYISCSIDYQSGSVYLYAWSASQSDTSTELTLPFASTDSWSVTTSGSTIYICGTSSSCASSYSLRVLSVFLGAYLNQGAHFQRYTNQITPWINLVFYSSESATDQVSAKTFPLGVAPAPSYDTSTDSLNFPVNGRYLKWTVDKTFGDPKRMITILMRLSFNLGTDCGYQKIFSRKTSTNTERYSFGFSSSIAPGSLVFSYTYSGVVSRTAVPETSVFNNDYFHTIAISVFIFDTMEKFLFTVSINGSTPTTSPSGSLSLATQYYEELATDEFWIGDNACSFRGKLQYLYLWNNGGMDNQMDCLPGCSFTLGTVSDQMTCLDMCHPSCLTCNGNSSTDCLSCHSGRLRHNPNNSPTFRCVLSCPTGFYSSEGNTECLLCDSSCLSCTNGTACLQCKSTYPVKVGLSASLCYNSCPELAYEDMNLGRCLDCDSSCSNCSGPSSQNCTSCNASYFLDLVTPTADSGSCIKCDPSCNTCLGPTGNNCTSCNAPLILNRSSCQVNSTSAPNRTNTTINLTKDDSATQIAITTSSTMLTTMSYAPTAAVFVSQFATSSVSSFTSGISSYNLYSYLALIKIASLFVLVNIPFRQRILDFFKATISSQSFPNFFSIIVDDSVDNQFRDGAFSRIAISGQFLLNYGGYMSQQSLFLLIAVFFHVLTHVLRKNPKVSAILSKITAALYNMVIINLTGSQIPFLIGVVATITSGSYKDSAGGLVSLILMILMICAWLGFFAFIAILLFKGESLKVSKEAAKAQRHLGQNKVSLKEVLSEGILAPFIADRLQRQVALPLKFIKIMCVTMLIGMSQSYPLLQIIPPIVLQLFWLILDAWSDSKKSKVDFVFNLLENFFVLISFIACLLIAVVDNVGAFDFVMIGVLSSALISRTIHVIVGVIGAIVMSVCSKKQPPTQDKIFRVKRSSRRHQSKMNISEEINSSNSIITNTRNETLSKTRSSSRVKASEKRIVLPKVHGRQSRRYKDH